MKHIVKIIAAVAVLGSFGHAQTLKVGIVNMQDVLQGYYKSKQAQVELNQRRDDIKKDLDGRRDKLRSLMDEVEKLQKIIRDEDGSTTPEFKRLKMQEFENKMGEGRALQRDLEQLAKQKERQLMLELERTFRGIRDEVKVVVDEVSKKDGYDFVFDKSAVGMGGSNFLLFSKDAVDFTQAIVASLNKDAPADFKNAPPAELPKEDADKPKDKDKEEKPAP